MPDVQKMNLSKIIKRLQLIKSLISLEEEDEVDTHVLKLEQLGITEELETIILSLKDKSVWSTGKKLVSSLLYFAPKFDILDERMPVPLQK
jgi:hypothetical protein